MQTRILFVDDEPNVLVGLRRMLRPMSREWDMAFAEGAVEALDLLDRQRFDVIVSDMRMPGMSGADLLERSRSRCPDMVRVILTGQCDRDSGVRALRIAHQLLDKPCDPAILKATIARVAALKALLAEQAVASLLSTLAPTPALPDVLEQMLAGLDTVTSSLDAVEASMGKDLGIPSEAIRIATPSFFGLRGTSSAQQRDSSLIRLEMLRVLVLAVSLLSSFQAGARQSFSIEELQRYSWSVCTLARDIAKMEGADPRSINQAGIAGLLLDIGKLVLLKFAGADYAKLLADAKERNKPDWECERAEFGASHAEVGAALLSMWGLPFSIVEAVAWHHRPSQSGATSFGVLTAVHAASVLTPEAGVSVLDLDYLKSIKAQLRWPMWRQKAEAIRASEGMPT